MILLEITISNNYAIDLNYLKNDSHCVYEKKQFI